jgi:hypothetical protein
MKLGYRYRVIESVYKGVRFPGDPSYEYMIQDTNGKGSVVFIESPFQLPSIFWVRGLLTWHTQYEILPENHEGTPLQVELARGLKDSFSVA